MLRRTCTSASFSDPINELSGNTGSNDQDGANKDSVHTGTANIDAASTIVDKEITTNKGPAHTETANAGAARKSIENENTINKAPVRTESAYVDAATSTNIDKEDTTNKGLVHTQIASIDTAVQMLTTQISPTQVLPTQVLTILLMLSTSTWPRLPIQALPSRQPAAHGPKNYAKPVIFLFLAKMPFQNEHGISRKTHHKKPKDPYHQQKSGPRHTTGPRSLPHSSPTHSFRTTTGRTNYNLTASFTTSTLSMCSPSQHDSSHFAISATERCVSLHGAFFLWPSEIPLFPFEEPCHL